MHVYLLFLAFAFLPLSSEAQLEEDSFQLGPPNKLDSLMHFPIWATEYYAHETSSSGTIPYLTMSGDTLGYFSDLCNFCTACLEGTVIMESDSNEAVVLNYAGRSKEAIVNCRECPKFQKSELNVESWGTVRWKKSFGFGEGVKNYQLVPYRTIAVDPNKMPYGTVVFIPEAVGAIVQVFEGANSYVHDGYFFAGDTGGAIKKNHIDVFTGVDASHPFEFVKSSPKHTVECYLVTDETIIEFLKQYHIK